MALVGYIAEAEGTEGEGLVAMFLADALVPIRKLQGVISRTTFHRFRKDGLDTYHVVGLGVCIRPSELIQYLNDRSSRS